MERKAGNGVEGKEWIEMKEMEKEKNGRKWRRKKMEGNGEEGKDWRIEGNGGERGKDEPSNSCRTTNRKLEHQQQLSLNLSLYGKRNTRYKGTVVRQACK